jgi:hypothetical protein
MLQGYPMGCHPWRGSQVFKSEAPVILEFGEAGRNILSWIIRCIQDRDGYFEVEASTISRNRERTREAQTQQEQEEQIIDSNLDPLRGDVEYQVNEMLTNPNALSLIKTHLDNLIAGEDENKQIIFLLLLSVQPNLHHREDD